MGMGLYKSVGGIVLFCLFPARQSQQKPLFLSQLVMLKFTRADRSLQGYDRLLFDIP